MYGYPHYQAPPPIQPHPYSPYSSANQMAHRLRELEAQQNATIGQSPYGPVGNQPGFNMYGQSTTAPASAQISLVSVQSVDDAWKYPADFAGNKQYFINDRDGEIYIKRFDANIPETVREVYKKIMPTVPTEEEKAKEDPLLPVISGIYEQVGGLENKIIGIEGYIQELIQVLSSNHDEAVKEEKKPIAKKPKPSVKKIVAPVVQPAPVEIIDVEE